MSAGKGSKPRSCFSKDYKNNYDQIKWSNKKPNDRKKNISKNSN
jgi:hypothetical protein